MSAIALTCRNCGRVYDFPSEAATRPCPSCGTVHGRPKSSGDPLTWLCRANQELAACDFKHAADDFRQVLGRHPDEHMALWGLVMCKYGVESVTDSRTKEKRPTLHFLRRKPITEDGDFLLACARAKAEPEVHREYLKEAAYIEAIQRQLLAAEGPREPVDIFLCYKGSGPDGHGYARERHHAASLYTQLLRAGYNVFFAEESLAKDAAGANYEAWIFHALSSARVMLVICSDPANLQTPWVHSEWSRYLERVDKGETCTLIPLLYDGCDPYALPDEFVRRSLHGLRMDEDELNALDNLRGNLKKLLRTEAPAADDGEDELISISYDLRQGEWEEVSARARELMKKHPRCSRAYLYRLLATLQISDPQKLREQTTPFEQSVDWEFAIKYAGAAERAKLTEILSASQALRDRLEAEKKRWSALQKECAAAAKRKDWAALTTASTAMAEQRPDSPEGYRGRLLAFCSAGTVEEMANSPLPFEMQPDWKKLLARLPQKEQERMESCLDASRQLRARLAEEARQAAERAEAEKRARLTKLLSDGNWPEAEKLAAELSDQVAPNPQTPLLRLLTKYRLHNEAELDTTHAWLESREWLEEAARAAEIPKRARQLRAHIGKAEKAREAEAARKAEEARRAAAERAEAEKRARLTKLLSDGNWPEAEKLAATLSDTVAPGLDTPLLRLLTKYRLHNEAELDTRYDWLESSGLLEKVARMTETPERARQIRQHIVRAEETRRAEEERRRREAEEARRAEEERRLAAERAEAEKRAKLKTLLSGGNWAEAEKLAAMLSDSVAPDADVPLLRLLTKHRLHDEAELDTRYDWLESRNLLEMAATVAETPERAQQLWSHIDQAEEAHLVAEARKAEEARRAEEARLAEVERAEAEKRAKLAQLLSDGKWDEAETLAAELSDEAAPNPDTPLLRLLTKHRLHDEAELDTRYDWLESYKLLAAARAAQTPERAQQLWLHVDKAQALREAAVRRATFRRNTPGMLLAGVPMVALALLQYLWPAATGLSALVACLYAIILCALGDWSERPERAVKDGYGRPVYESADAGKRRILWCGGVMAGLAAICLGLSIFLKLPLWAVLCMALVLCHALLTEKSNVAQNDEGLETYVFMWPPLLWLWLHLVAGLLTQFFDFAWLQAVARGIAWAGPAVALLVMAALSRKEKWRGDSKPANAILWVIFAVPFLAVVLVVLALALALLLWPYTAFWGQSVHPDWAGVISLGVAVLLYVLYAFTFAEEEGGTSFLWAAIPLTAAAVLAAIFLPIPQWGFMCIAMVLLIVTLLMALFTLDSGWAATVVFFALWALLNAATGVAGAFVDAPWMDVVSNIVNLWLPAVFLLAGYLLAFFDVDITEGLQAAMGILLGLVPLALPTWGLVIASQVWPACAGLIAFGVSMLVYFFAALTWQGDESSGGGTFALVGLLLVAAVVCAAIFLQPPQFVYHIVVCLTFIILNLLLLSNLGEGKAFSLPLTLWMTLYSGSAILSAFVQASWVGVVASIVSWWLPIAVLLVTGGFVLYVIGDDNGWW